MVRPALSSSPRVLYLLVLAAALMSLGVSVPDAAAAEPKRVVVVVHEAVPVRDLGLVELRELVLGQRRFWGGGARVELIVEANGGLGRRGFVETVSKMTDLQFQQYWVGQIFSQRATRAPRAAPDRRLALALVSAIPGALTIVEDGPLPPRTRIVTVDGFAPGDARYPLK
jgi:hypothetical protein